MNFTELFKLIDSHEPPDTALAAALPVAKTPSPDGKLPQLWIWASLLGHITLPQSLENVEALISEGWVYTTESRATLESQLYDTAGLYKEEDHQSMQIYYKPDPEGREPLPVVLAFSIESKPNPENIPMLNPFPLPQMGEYAFVEQDGGELYSYYIMQLPLQARQRWMAFGELLKSLAAPLLWPAYHERHQLAFDEQRYQIQQFSFTQQRKLALEPTKSELLIRAGMLQAAHLHIEQLRKMLQKPTLLEQWRMVQTMARDLARDYYEYHEQQNQQGTSATIEPEPEPEPDRERLQAYQAAYSLVGEMQEIEEEETEPEELRLLPPAASKPVPARQRRRRTATQAAATRKPDFSMRSDEVNREIIDALRNKGDYKPIPDRGIAEQTRQFHNEEGQITITIKPLENEGWETVLSALNTLGDACIDTYIATMGIAIERNGLEHIRTPFMISPDDILEFCGKKKSNRAYTPFQRAEVIKHLKTLSQAHVIATMPGPGRRRGPRTEPTTLKAEGAIIDLLSFKIGEYSTITGEEIWEKRSISIGEWINIIPQLNNQTATMLRKVLEYSAKNERYQKRLGIYLTFMFRINARHGGAFERSLNAVLDGAGIIAPRQQGEFREAIENALAMLHKHNVIGDYARIVDSSPTGQEQEAMIREHAKGWWAVYGAQKWRFEPPDYAKTKYQKLLRQP